MFDIPELKPTNEDLTNKAKEKSFKEAVKIMADLGYNTVQEVVVDLMIEGEYNKAARTWTEITDPSDIKTTRAHMNLVQAKYYGLEIIRAEPE